MKIQAIVAAVTLSVALTSCATPVTMVPTGGSRSDGTVNMSYEFGLFQKPVVDVAQATSSANETCSGWGYSGSKPFGGQTSKCEAMDGNGNCLRFMVTVAFQCTGAPSAGH